MIHYIKNTYLPFDSMSISLSEPIDSITLYYRDRISHYKKFIHVIHHIRNHYTALYYQDIGVSDLHEYTELHIENVIKTLHSCNCCTRHQENKPDSLSPNSSTYLMCSSLDDIDYLNENTKKRLVRPCEYVRGKHVYCHCLCRHTARECVRIFNENAFLEQERICIIHGLHGQLEYTKLALKLFLQHSIKYKQRLRAFIYILQKSLEDIVISIQDKHVTHLSHEQIQNHIDLNIIYSFRKNVFNCVHSMNEGIIDIYSKWQDITSIYTNYETHCNRYHNIHFPQDDEIQDMMEASKKTLRNGIKEVLVFTNSVFLETIKQYFQRLDSICNKKSYFYKTLYVFTFDGADTIIRDIRNTMNSILELSSEQEDGIFEV